MKPLRWAIGGLVLAVAGTLAWSMLADPGPPPNADMVYTDHSYRKTGEVFACLRAPVPAGLGLAASDQPIDERNPATGVTVRIEDRHDFRKIWVYVDRGRSFTPEQRSAVKACTGRPDNR